MNYQDLLTAAKSPKLVEGSQFYTGFALPALRLLARRHHHPVLAKKPVYLHDMIGMHPVPLPKGLKPARYAQHFAEFVNNYKMKLSLEPAQVRQPANFAASGFEYLASQDATSILELNTDYLKRYSYRFISAGQHRLIHGKVVLPESLKGSFPIPYAQPLWQSAAAHHILHYDLIGRRQVYRLPDTESFIKSIHMNLHV